MRRLIVFLIRIYQRYWSSWHPPVCRFTPNCSEYAIEALMRHGIWRGSFFILRRLLRCHPWNAGGYDPVP
ncbi:MAG TPA: membrane protein insertion efficiency factor YidD [Syntrophomonadaceae bacterium]|nr:membrane protein insertion efficiency factor YidD [Syntrophomonadaceae bacterium]